MNILNTIGQTIRKTETIKNIIKEKINKETITKMINETKETIKEGYNQQVRKDNKEVETK